MSESVDSDEEFEAELRRRFEELDKLGIDVNSDSDKEDTDSLFKAEICSSDDNDILFDRERYLEDIKRDMMMATNSLIFNLQRLQEELEITPENVASSVSNDVKENCVENTECIINEDKGTCTEILDEKNDKEKKAYLENLIKEKKEMMNRREIEHQRELAKIEEMKIEKLKHMESIQREYEQEIILAERNYKEETKKKLQHEKKRIFQEQKKKEEEERKKGEEERGKEEERRRIEKLKELQLIEEKRRHEEGLKRKKQEEEMKLRLFQDSIRILQEQFTTYKKEESFKFVNSISYNEQYISSEQINMCISLIQLLHDWQRKEKEFKSNAVHSFLFNGSFLNNQERREEEFDFAKEGRLILNENLIRFNFGYDLNNRLSDIVSIKINIENIESIDPLIFQKCPSLRSLTLNQNSLRSIKGTLKHSKLEELSIDQNYLTSLSGLEDVSTSLRSLSAQSNDIMDIRHLLCCTNLTRLNLSMNTIESFDYLTGLSQLEILKLYRNQVSHIPNLGTMKSLTHLDLGRNNLTFIRSDALSSCNLLSELILYENNIQEFPTLQNVLLRILMLNGNKISKLPEPFIFSPMLVILNLSSNNLQSLKSLSYCIMLQNLDVSFNQISDIRELLYLELCKRLEYLQLNDNPVSTMAGYCKTLIAILPKIYSIDNCIVDQLEKQQIREYYLTHSYDLISNLSARMYRRLILGTEEEMERDYMDNYECMCVRQATEARILKSIEDKEVFISLAQGEDQKRKAAVLEVSKHFILLKKKMRLRHHKEHLEFEDSDTWNMLIVNDAYRRRKAAIKLQEFFRSCHKKIQEKKLKLSIKIQSLWRGYVCRKRNLSWIREKIAIKHYHATKIQALWKGYYVRLLIRRAKQLEDEYNFELQDVNISFEDDLKFLDDPTNFDIIGDFPKRTIKENSVIDDSINTKEKEVKPPNVVLRQNWVEPAPQEEEKEEIPKKVNGKISAIAEEWGLSSDSKVFKAMIASKRRKPKNHKKKDNSWIGHLHKRK